MPAAPLRPKKARKRGPNATELRFGAYLDILVRLGELRERSLFEPERIKLAQGAFYRPDYTAIDKQGRRVIYDVKGTKRSKVRRVPVPYVKEASRLRLKFLASLRPDWRVVIVFPIGDQWAEQEVKG